MGGKLAIVGAGPSGCYLAQALLRARADLEIDVIDALPVPYGLVRYGVATDHQGTKAVVRQFARVFERAGARFFGNVQVGTDVTLDALRDAYDSVVLSTGMSVDRRLGVPGDTLPGVLGSGALTRALYEHPDEATALPTLGADVVIIGNGNVAIDLARVLAKRPPAFAGTDLGAAPTAWAAQNTLRSITIVGRASAAKARFDAAMLKELGKLDGVTISVEGPVSPDTDDARLAALAQIDGVESGPLRLVFAFDLTAERVEGDERVTGVRFRTADGAIRHLRCDALLTAIGFEDGGVLPRDALLGAGAADGCLAPGLYAAGWFHHGPRGTIADSRARAKPLAARILERLEVDPGKAGSAVFDALPAVVTYAGWKRIDAAEVAAAGEDRCRQKFSRRDRLLAVAQPTGA